MSRPFLFNSVVFLTILDIYCGHLRGVVGTDDGLVHIPLQKSQDVSSKIDSVGPEMEIKSSTLVPSNAFTDRLSVIKGQLNTGLDDLSKNDVDKNKFADAKTENVPLDTKPVPLDAVKGQIEITQRQMNKVLDVFQASIKKPGENTEKQAKNAVAQNINETAAVKENVHNQAGAQVEQHGVQKSTNAEANMQDRKQPEKTSQHASSTQDSQKQEIVDLNAFAESLDNTDPEVTDYSSELSDEFTSAVYPFAQKIGAASGENDKADTLDSMPVEDDFQVDDDDDADSTKEQTKPKWFDEMMDDEDEEKKENDVVGTDDGLVHIPLLKSQDVTSKIDSVGPEMEIKSSTLVPSNAFRYQISIIMGQLNTGLDALSKNDVDKNKFADAKTENVPLDTKPVPLDAVQGQIEITQSQMNKVLDVFQASIKQPGENTEKQAKIAVEQIINETAAVKENVNNQAGAQVEQNGVQKSTNAEANTQDRKQPENTSQHASSTQNSQKQEIVDLKAFSESLDNTDPDVTDYSSELSVEFTSAVYPFSQKIGAASGENDKADTLDSMPVEDDFQVDDDDDADSTKEQIKPKWFDEMIYDEDEEKKENDGPEVGKPVQSLVQ